MHKLNKISSDVFQGISLVLRKISLIVERLILLMVIKNRQITCVIYFIDLFTGCQFQSALSYK